MSAHVDDGIDDHLDGEGRCRCYGPCCTAPGGWCICTDGCRCNDHERPR